MTIGLALETLQKQYNCWITASNECPIQCEKCENDVDFADFLEALKTVLDAFGNRSELPNSSDDCVSRQADLIDRAEAQTELQFATRRYTVAKEAHGEGQVIWSENLISVTDAMNALRKVPPVQVERKWTPCSEALPKDNEYVLLTIRRLNKAYNQLPFISIGYVSWNGMCWWCAHDGDCKSNDIDVMAWRPLPEPYRGDDK